MKKLAFIFIALCAWQFSVAQSISTDTCFYTTSFSVFPVGSNNQVIGGAVTDIYQGVDYEVDLPSTLQPTSVKLNGVTLLALPPAFTGLATGFFRYKFNSSVPGAHTIKAIGTYVNPISGSCTKFNITFPIYVKPLFCGYSVQKLPDMMVGCLDNSNPALQVNYTGSGVLQSNTIVYEDGSMLTYQANDTIQLTKYTTSRVLKGGYSTVLLPNGTLCQAPIINTLSYGPFFESDPRFELSGSIEANTPFDVYFIGQPSPSSLMGNLSYTFQVNYSTGGLAPSTLLTKTNLNEGELITSLTLSGGDYTLMLIGMNVEKACKDTTIQLITIERKETESCAACFTFKPQIGKRYWASAWVKVETTTPVITYPNVSVKLNYKNAANVATGTSTTLAPTGNIIDGWQRIAGEFTVPAGTIDLQVQLVNSNPTTTPAYFDDLRIHPFNASMKSYVYDPSSFLLVAELDDNNYATYYEYDKEGQLIRIKKETEKGVMTIQESRSSNPKKQ